MTLVPGLLTLIVILVTPASGQARCGDDPGDAQAVADAREQVQIDCPCAAAPSHGAHVRCAADVAAERIGLGLLPRQCRSAVKRCAARSTCGKPGFVTCCRERNGVTKCRTARDAARCTADGGTPSSCSSCCDACTSACGTTSTTSSTTVTTSTSTTATTVAACGGVEGPDLCWGECPPDTVCAVVSGQCGCIAGTTPCGDTRSPECDGVCPAGQTCVSGGGDCGCIPTGSTPCVTSQPSTCGGACPPGVTCTFISSPDFTGCVCPPTFCGTYPTCGEPCPPPKDCVAFPVPGLQSCICQVP